MTQEDLDDLLNDHDELFDQQMARIDRLTESIRRSGAPMREWVREMGQNSVSDRQLHLPYHKRRWVDAA